MINLKHRSKLKELLDADDIPFTDIQQNMKELNTINTLLGGHAITIQGFKEIYKNSNQISICEIGCGGGDNLAVIHEYCQKNNIDANFMGIDLKQSCIDFAQQQYPFLPCQWMVSDYKAALFPSKPHIIFSSLFCHHFSEPDLLFMLAWMKQNSRSGFFINDLERNILAYHSIKFLTRIFSNSYLVKHDAPLSVARGFKKTEWISLLKKAGTKEANVLWKWAFRHLIIFKH